MAAFLISLLVIAGIIRYGAILMALAETMVDGPATSETTRQEAALQKDRTVNRTLELQKVEAMNESSTSRDGPAEHSAEVSDRALALCSSTQLELKLGEILHEFLLDSSAADQLLSGALASLTTRALACRSLALIEENEFADCMIISKISDDFHRLGHASYASESVMSKCRKLHFRDRRHSASNSAPKEQFRSAVSALSERLANRPFYIGHETRTRRTWPI
jgi:hypothetical protein